MTDRFTNSFRFYCLLFIALCSLTVQAQSGRRQAPAPAAAPVPTPTPEPTPVPKPERKSELSFLVGIDDSSTLTFYPLSFYDVVVSGCADRLRKGSSATVDVAQRMNRSDAIKKAKSEKTTYVVWMQLISQAMSTAESQSYDQIAIEYIVYAPTTAKVVTSGHSYQNSNRQGPLIIGPTTTGTNSALYREQLLKRAGEEAGDRILHALHLVIPSNIPNAF
jgi:hypothetical protein